ncbi:inosine 5'-monophosphate dehydrogenase [Bifidobacterium moukalabense DSM 27321]|uniref:Inosine 5'-monophosphate dehydrogenase n=1 Tax=Bifidobacterium moukalabense DSM 27321 TaxID=1435051 RepID=W4N9A9_9BIFI|nr:inosine 5'-monophosphate dehydrogenase [Bifidobacterium moukalabense DSM 27321]
MDTVRPLSLLSISLEAMSQEIEIGLGKKGRLAYSLDDVAIVPSRRTRDPQDVSTAWQVDAYEFDIPVIGAPMDSVTSPATAIAMGKMGALGVLDLEGLWTRYDDPQPLLDEIAQLPADQATSRIQRIYAEPIKPELIVQRLHEIRDAGVTVAGALSPQRTQDYYSTVLDAGVDLFVIRGTVVSAEHVSRNHEPLNLKKFIYDLDVPVIVGGAANYTAALHLMRTGAAGVLVGFGGGAVSANRNTIGVHAPMATAIADVAEARRDYMDESGGRYVQVIADGSMGDSGSFVKAFALGADAVMLGSPLARAEEAPGAGDALGYRGPPSDAAAWFPHERRHRRIPGERSVRSEPSGRWHHQFHRCSAPCHGHHGLCRSQEFPALLGNGRSALRPLTFRF